MQIQGNKLSFGTKIDSFQTILWKAFLICPGLSQIGFCLLYFSPSWQKLKSRIMYFEFV